MRCYLRRLTSVVSFLLIFSSLAFTLDLEGFINRELKKRFGEEVKLSSFRILSSIIPEKFDGFELKVNKGNPRGYLYLKKGNKVFSIALNLLWKCKLLLARKNIEPGERLREDKVRVNYSYLKRCPRIPEGSLRNYVSRKFIKAGALIEKSSLRKEFLVKRGDKVKAFYEKGGIRIEFESVAFDNGYWGDFIRLKSPFSERLIRGIVEDEGVVKILD